jgi:hypothetical protein
MLRQATTKRHFEHSAMQFSDGCCLNITSLKTAAGRPLMLPEARDYQYKHLKQQWN